MIHIDDRLDPLIEHPLKQTGGWKGKHGGMRTRLVRTAPQSKDGEGNPSLPVRDQPC